MVGVFTHCEQDTKRCEGAGHVQFQLCCGERVPERLPAVLQVRTILGFIHAHVIDGFGEGRCVPLSTGAQ
jgi:hypothetical protein